MTLEELQARRNHIDNAANATLSNMEVIRNETVRVQKVAHNAEGIFRDIEAEFEKQTKLNRVDQEFLLLAIGLQFLRVYLVNKATDLEKAEMNDAEEKPGERKKQTKKPDPQRRLKEALDWTKMLIEKNKK